MRNKIRDHFYDILFNLEVPGGEFERGVLHQEVHGAISLYESFKECFTDDEQQCYDRLIDYLDLESIEGLLHFSEGVDLFDAGLSVEEIIEEFEEEEKK